MNEKETLYLKISYESTKKMAEKSIKLPTLDLLVDRYAAFQAWSEKWQDYVLLTELDKKPAEYQAAICSDTHLQKKQEIYTNH